MLVAYAEEAIQNVVMLSQDWPTSLDHEDYAKQLHEIRKQGFATSYEEREPGAAAVSAPIFDRDGKIVAALSISGPVSRLTQEKLLELGEPVVKAARQMGMMVPTWRR
ncbi:HTH-type transcriptional repressor AllR [compost metagenome]